MIKEQARFVVFKAGVALRLGICPSCGETDLDTLSQEILQCSVCHFSMSEDDIVDAILSEDIYEALSVLKGRSK